jgi:AcrR family transcriptional regulator
MLMKLDNFKLAVQEVESLGGTAMGAEASAPNSGLVFDNQVRRYLKAAVRRHDLTARRNRTLASVLQEWTEVGYVKAQVASIANRAGMSTATLYKQFPDKTVLYCEALKFGHSILLDALATYSEHPNPIRDLTALLCNYAETISQPAPQQMLLAQSIMLLDPELQADVSAIASENHTKIKQIWYGKIQKMAEDGLVRIDQLEWQRCRLVGAVEIQIVRWFMMGQSAHAPEGDWQAASHQVVHDFFKLYGTDKFNQQKILYNWDWGLHARP